MLKHYVEYMFPGVRVQETSVREIPERDVSMVKISDDHIAFRFFDRNEAVEDGEILAGNRKNVSGWHYLGEKMTLKQVVMTYGNDGKHNTLINSMVLEDWSAVVKARSGQFFPLMPEDTVIDI